MQGKSEKVPGTKKRVESSTVEPCRAVLRKNRDYASTQLANHGVKWLRMSDRQFFRKLLSGC